MPGRPATSQAPTHVTWSDHSCILDDGSTNVIDGTLLEVSGWYDNECGYAYRCVDLLRYMGQRL
jgi:glyceraldehyde 3-phosphate dehydrogenase